MPIGTTSGVLGLKDTTSRNRIPLRLFILFSNCCSSLTALCDPRLFIILQFLFLQILYVPHSLTRHMIPSWEAAGLFHRVTNYYAEGL